MSLNLSLAFNLNEVIFRFIDLSKERKKESGNWFRLHQHFMRRFFDSKFTPILLVHGVEQRAQKLTVYLAVHTSKVGQFLLVKQKSAEE